MRKIILSTIAAFSCIALAAQGSGMPQGSREKLEQHVYFLADDSLMGRAAGSPYSAKAREYITGEFAGLGIRPFFNDWEMPFEVKGAGSFCNVVGIIDGADPVLKNEYIVLGAHYDHLGMKNGEVYNGADDNASGTAAVIEVARALAGCRENLDRSVIIAAFDAEELGLFGSSALAAKMADTLGVGRIKLMMSLDMVGWYRQSGYLMLDGIGTVKDGKKLARAEATKTGINIRTRRFEMSPFTATDTEGFARRGVPTLAVTTGLKSPYHKPEDDADLIDYDGLAKVSGYVTDLTVAAAGDPGFSGSGKVAEKHRSNYKLFEFGLWGALAPTSVTFPDAKLRSESRAGWTGGISTQLNTGNFGFRLGAEYSSLPCRFPDSADLYGSSLKYMQHAVTVPLSILLQTGPGSPIRGYFGIGGYYRHILESGFDGGIPAYTAKPGQWGWQWTIGYKITHFAMELEYRWQIGGMFSGASDPRSRTNTPSIKIGYIF